MRPWATVVRGKNGHVWSGALNVGLPGEIRLLAPQRCFPLRRQHAGSDRSEDAKTGAVSKKPKTTVSNIATVRRIRVIVSGLFVWARAPEFSRSSFRPLAPASV